MCGRYAFYLSPGDLKTKLGLENLLDIPPRYNCAPMQNLPVVIKNRMGFARWGFRPEWAEKDEPSMAVKMVNARSETVSEKPAFRESWARKRRCLVPVNGFYEWSKDAHTGVNQPYYIRNRQTDVLFLAGLWSKVEEQVSFTILTKQADDNLSHLHHRSPVMVGEEDVTAWFGGDDQTVCDVLSRSTTHDLCFHKVGKAIGNVANDHERLMDEVSDEDVLREVGRLL